MLVSQMFKQKAAHKIVTAPPSMTVAEAARVLRDEKIGALMVAGEDGRLAGILSERDIVRAMPDHGAELLTMTVATLMTSSVVTAKPNSHLTDLMRDMTAGRFRHMPVIDGEAIAGMISIGDVVACRVSELEAESEQMRQYIGGN